MMIKTYRIAFVAVFSTIALLYFFNLNTNPATSDYEFLALADHEKLVSGTYAVRTNNQLETSTINASNMFAPAINPVVLILELCHLVIKDIVVTLQ